jgi:hypothetical protein
MKKLLFALIIMLLGTSTNAQPQEGNQFDPAAIKERQKSKLKEDLKLSETQAEDVATIQLEFMPKMRGLRGLQTEERVIKLKEIGDAFKTKLKFALKDDKLVYKVIEYQEAQRKERMEKMRGNQ